MAVTVGVDFGGTTLEAGRVDGGRVVARARSPTGAGRPAAAILDAVADLVQGLGAERVGVAIPGEVREDGRCWRLPNVPGFEGVPIAAELEGRLRRPVRVENDATAAALGELREGHGLGVGSFLLVTLGTGIGGGLALDGRVRRGRHGFAGEIGHVRIESGVEAWPCGCGRSGCLESRAGTAGILRALREAGGPPAGAVREVAERARSGEAAARAALASAGRALGVGLASIQNVLDLDAVIFSGGVAASLDLLEPSLREGLAEASYAPALSEVPCLTSALGGDAGIIGAAELFGPAEGGPRGEGG